MPLAGREFTLALNPKSKNKKSRVWTRVGEAPTAVRMDKKL